MDKEPGMSEVDRIRAVKESLAAELHAIPGVHAVGVGAKVSGGTKTDQLAIVFFVVKKKNLDQLAPAEVVPREIQGIQTDVVEMPRISLLNANPDTIVISVLPPPGGSGAIVSMSGKPVPDNGLTVVVDVILTNAGGVSTNLFASRSTDGLHTLADVAGQLATRLTVPGLTATASPGPPAQVTVLAAPGFTAQVPRAFVLAEDSTKYFPEYLRGGIRVKRGGERSTGTLGVLATTAPTAQDPKGKVLAITNFHVVCPIADRSTNLGVANPDQMNVTFSITDGKPAVSSETQVVASISDRTPPNNLLFDAIYITAPGDTPVDVARGVVKALSDTPFPGIVSQAGATVQVIAAADFDCQVFGAPEPNSRVDLFGTVTIPVPGTCEVTFAGKVSSENYGIFLNINPGGSNFTVGSFTNPKKGRDLVGLADDVAKAINAIPAPMRGTVSATPGGAKVTITHAQQVECRIVGDIQVGQPDDSFGSPCSRCCSHRIGRILDAQIHADAAIIQLDPDLKYKPSIQDITGGLNVTQTPTVGMNVQKRGVTSGRTLGAITHVGVSAVISLRGDFFRACDHGFLIASSTSDPFSLPGDSGSAVVTQGGSNSVVGLLFGHTDTDGFATEVGQVIGSFPALNLSFSPAPGTSADTVQIVPKPASAFGVLEGAGSGERVRESAPQGFEGTYLGQRLNQAEAELRATERGRELADLVRRHFPEALSLVNGNRRVAAVWRRSGGPEILDALFRAVQFESERLPPEINGRTLSDCLGRIQQVVLRYASPAFSADLGRHAPQLVHFSRMSYAELLHALETANGE